METREPCSEQSILHDPAESCPAAVRYAMVCLDRTTTLCVIMCYHTASEQNYALLAPLRSAETYLCHPLS